MNNDFFKITSNNVENIFYEIDFDKNNKNNQNNKNNKKRIEEKLEKKIIDYKFETTKILDLVNSINNSSNSLDNAYSEKNLNNIKNDRMIWEFGKSGIKLEKLKYSMSKNLAILFYINKLFINFINHNPKINLENILNINWDSTKSYYSCEDGIVYLSNNSINLKLINKKISGLYKIIDCGYIKFYDINIDEIYLKKNKIPNLESILAHSDNIKHIEKIIKIFENASNIKTKSNFMGKLNWINLLEEYLPIIITNINNKSNLFNIDKKFSFYIKVYSTHTKAFIIDKNTQYIYYLSSLENYKNSNFYLFMYVFELDSQYKIINLLKKSKNIKSSSLAEI